PETIAARDPDVVITIADSDDARLPAFASAREWQVVRAVRERRVLTLPGALFGRPSPRAAAAVAELRRRLQALRWSGWDPRPPPCSPSRSPRCWALRPCPSARCRGLRSSATRASR